MFFFILACIKHNTSDIPPPHVCKSEFNEVTAVITKQSNNLFTVESFVTQDFDDETERDLLPNARLLALDCVADFHKVQKIDVQEVTLVGTRWQKKRMTAEFTIVVP
jgi:hypothetical protein